MLAILLGCVGGADRPGSSATDTATTSAPPMSTPAATPAAGPAASPGAQITPQLIALGDSIFQGKVAGGTCQTCHGAGAKGTMLAPDLTDNQWHNGDGSYQFIVNTITNGVLKPMKYPGPMPPKGGAPLTPEQVKAVAAYVYSLSRKGS